MKTKSLAAVGTSAVVVAFSVLLPACGPGSAPPNPLVVEAGADAASADAKSDAAEDGGSTDAASD